MNIEDVHKNSKLLLNGAPNNVDEAEFVKPGKGRAIYRLKLRNLIDDKVVEYTFHSGDQVDEANISTTDMQYLYNDGEHYTFMDTETFEQFIVDKKKMGEKKNFLKEGTIVTVVMMNDTPIGVTLPNFVELKVMETQASNKTDTITAQSKAVVLETGDTIGVPAFIKEGDIIKIDTRSSSYVERVNKK
ncbi:elongation factor P [Chloroflexota bacterium]